MHPTPQAIAFRNITPPRRRRRRRPRTPNTEKIMKNHVFHCFFKDLLVKTHSKTSGKPVRSFWTGLSLPRPFPSHFTSILHLWFFLKHECFFEKICSIFWSIFKVFPIFSLFLELWRLWDHSQIVDLIFLNRMVSMRASESSKTPHSWQNNVPKRSTRYF